MTTHFALLLIYISFYINLHKIISLPLSFISPLSFFRFLQSHPIPTLTFSLLFEIINSTPDSDCETPNSFSQVINELITLVLLWQWLIFLWPNNILLDWKKNCINRWFSKKIYFAFKKWLSFNFVFCIIRDEGLEKNFR